MRQSRGHHLCDHLPVQRSPLWPVDLDHGGDLSRGVCGAVVDPTDPEGLDGQ